MEKCALLDKIIPRASGGVPLVKSLRAYNGPYSPRKRGCSAPVEFFEGQTTYVYYMLQNGVNLM